MPKHKYALGTQDMLDAAKDDATKLPFDTVFVTKVNKPSSDIAMPDTIECRRKCYGYDDRHSVGFVSMHDKEKIFHADASDLLPATQKKQKRIPWQNGTQEDLDKAKGNALKIPKKTYFMANTGELANKYPILPLLS